MEKEKGQLLPGVMLVGLGLSTAVSLLISLAGTAVLAWMAASEKLAESAIGYGLVAVLLAASAAGAFTATWKIRSRRMIVCGASGILYFLALLAITALFFDGQYEGVPVTALVVMGTSIAVGLLGIAGGGKGHTKRIRIKNR